MTSFSEEENAILGDDAQVEPGVSAHEAAFDEALPDAKPQTSFGSWLRRVMSGSPDQRLDDLTDAILEYPEAPANYVLRGQVLMDLGEYELAAGDFEEALTLAAAQFEEESWGLLSQTLRDQAVYELKRARQKLTRKQKRQS